MSDTNLYSAEQVFVKIFDDSDDEDDLHDLASDSDSDDQHSPSSSNNASALLFAFLQLFRENQLFCEANKTKILRLVRSIYWSNNATRQ